MIWNAIKGRAFFRYQKLLIVTALTLLTYYAALNRAQVFPWVLASLFLSSVITSYFFPRWLVRNMSVTRTGPKSAKENESVIFDINISNHGIMPRFMIQVKDTLPFIDQNVDGLKSHNQVLGVVAYIGIGATHRFKVSVNCEKRGRYQLGPVRVSTSFPFGLLEAERKENGSTQDLTIYPDIFPIMQLPLLGTPSEIHRGGFLLPKGAGSAEFSGLREYRQGDNPRHIHWPSSARTNELMIKEFEPLASARLHIILDQSKIANVGKGKHSTFEYAVRIAASIARHATDHSMSISISPGWKNNHDTGLGVGESHFQELLDYLAIIEANSDRAYATVLQDAAMKISDGHTAVIFISEPYTQTLKTMQSIALLKSRGANILAIHLDRDSFMEENVESDSNWLNPFDLEMQYILIKKDDNIASIFNS